MGTGFQDMKLFLLVVSVAAIASVYSVAEIVELGVDAAVASGADCDNIRASLPSICKLMPEQCATMKNKLRTSCAAQPEELIQTAAKQAPAEANLEADDDMGESTGRRGGGGFLSTSGSFTMSNRAGNSEEMNEEDLGESSEETSQDWDSQMSCKEDQAWMPMDATDEKLGKCVEFTADTKCSPQCFHQGKASTEAEPGAVCSKICRVPGAGSAQCNVVKMVKPIQKAGEQQMYLTRSKVMQAGLKAGDVADPMACAHPRA